MFFQSWSDFINMGGYGFMCGFPTALACGNDHFGDTKRQGA